jgi:TonB family protein
MLEQLLNNPFLYSLSLTLLHFLWQGLLVAVTLKSLLSIVANSESKLRYSLAILAMLANAILAVLTFIMVYPDTSSGANSNLSPIALTSLVSELTQQNPLLNYQELLPSILAYSLPYLSLLWLVSIAILASKLIIEIRNVNILPMRSSIAPSPELLVRFNQLVTQIQLTKTPQLLISLKAEVPMAIGWLKPVVLLPIAMITNLNSVQLEMLILHELAHIRRHDYLVNFFQTIIELLFFFHPSVHWVGKQIRNEREYCSDDIAVQHCGDAIAYAHTLTDTASLCSKKHFQTIPQMAMAASGGDLKARIIRLVDHHCAPTNYTSKWLAAFSLLIALSLLSINQLLTTPFAQQVNNKFPWQEQSISSKPAIIDLEYFIPVNDTLPASHINTISKGSIAKQLVGNNLINTTKITNINSLSAVISPVILPDEKASEINNEITILDIYKTEKFYSDESNNNENTPSLDVARSDNVIDTFKHKTNKSKLVSFNEKPEQRLSNLASLKQKAPVQAETKTEKVNEIIKSDLLNLSIKTPNSADDALILKASPINVTYVSSKHKVDSAPIITQTLLKKNPYTQLSYSNEINQLSRENKNYKASISPLNQTGQLLKIKDTALFKKDVSEELNNFDAKLLNSVSPVYPYLAKRRGIEMEVKVNFIIDRDGRVKDLKFDQQSKLIYFKSAIRSAMRKWRFNPATENNSKVESSMTKIFSFSLHA